MLIFILTFEPFGRVKFCAINRRIIRLKILECFVKESHYNFPPPFISFKIFYFLFGIANFPLPYIFPSLYVQTQRSRGYCFIYFDTLKSAIRAVESSSNLRIDSRYVRVDYSITTRARSPASVARYYDRANEAKAASYGQERERSWNRSRSGRGRSQSPNRRKLHTSFRLLFCFFVIPLI